MKILNSPAISSFWGLNFVLEELIRKGIGNSIDRELPELPAQSTYSWKDIIFTYWSIIFCGGDCAEDAAINLSQGLTNSPFIKVPSPDRLLERLKELSESKMEVKIIQILIKTLLGKIKFLKIH